MNRALFRNRTLLGFAIGRSAASFSTSFLQMALSLYLLAVTGSSGQFAFALTVGVLPQLLFGVFAGAIVDRVNHRRLLIVCDGGRGLLLAVLAIYTLFEAPGQAIIYGVIFALGLFNLFYLPATVVMLPAIVPAELLVDANAAVGTLTDTITLAAPTLAAMLYSHAGLAVVFAANAAIYLLSALNSFGLRMTHQPVDAKRRTVLHDVIEGLGLFRHDVQLRSLVTNGFLTHLFLTALVLMGFPYLIKNLFHGADLDVGLVESLATTGSISSVVIVAFLRQRVNLAQGLLIGMIGMVLAVVPMFALGFPGVVHLLKNTPHASAVFFGGITLVIFLMFGAYGVFFRSFYQQQVPIHMLGRFSAILTLVLLMGRTAGFQMYGYLLDRFPLLVSVAILGIGMALKIVVHIPFMRSQARSAPDVVPDTVS